MNVWRQLSLRPVVLVAGLAMAALPQAIAETFSLELKQMERQRGVSFRLTADSWKFVLRVRHPADPSSCRLEETGRGRPLRVRRRSSRALVKKQPEKYNSKHPLASGHAGLAEVSPRPGRQGAQLLGKIRPLLFDKNHNGDLTDDEPVDGDGVGGTDARPVQKLDLSSDRSRRSRPTAPRSTMPFSSRPMSSPPEKACSYVSASLNAAVYRDGEITLDGRRHRIVLIDHNSNGRFGDQARVDNEITTPDGQFFAKIGDMLVVDPVHQRDRARLLRDHRRVDVPLPVKAGQHRWQVLRCQRFTDRRENHSVAVVTSHGPSHQSRRPLPCRRLWRAWFCEDSAGTVRTPFNSPQANGSS